MKATILKSITCGVALLLLLPLAACKKKESAGLEKASLRLAWVYDMAEVGIFVAKDKGFYEEEGIDLEIKPGGFGLDPLKLVAAGSDTFGVGGGVNLLLAREKGLPLVSIAAEFQESPVGFITKKDSRILNFPDFKGRAVGIQTGSDTDTIYRALLNKFKMSSSDIKEVPIQFDPTPFVSGQIDVLPGYVTNQPITLANQSINTNVITAKSQGLSIYGNVYFVNEETLAKKPDLVAGFLRATKKGWNLALSSPEVAIQSIQARSNDFTEADLLKIHAAVTPFIKPDGEEQVLFQSLEKWKSTQEALVGAGLSTNPVEINKAFKSMD
jgi:NitT/TauT family transport system substrate-binding protein